MDERIKIKDSLCDFGGAYNKYRAYARSRLLTMETSYNRSLEVFNELESELEEFQRVIDDFPPNEPSVQLLNDANRARLAVMSAHRYHSQLSMHIFYHQHERDAHVAYDLAKDAVALHVDWLRAKTFGHDLALNALSIMAQNGYANCLLDLFLMLWTSSTKRKLECTPPPLEKRLRLEEEPVLPLPGALTAPHALPDLIANDPLSPRTRHRHKLINTRSLRLISKRTAFFKTPKKISPTATTAKKLSLASKYRARLTPRLLSRQKTLLW